MLKLLQNLYDGWKIHVFTFMHYIRQDVREGKLTDAHSTAKQIICLVCLVMDKEIPTPQQFPHFP